MLGVFNPKAGHANNTRIIEMYNTVLDVIRSPAQHVTHFSMSRNNYIPFKLFKRLDQYVGSWAFYSTQRV